MRAIHLDYFRAGADMVETNTFSGTSIAQADYGMEAVVFELNREGARLAGKRRQLRLLHRYHRQQPRARHGPAALDRHRPRTAPFRR